jgi:arsenite methyltransferase
MTDCWSQWLLRHRHGNDPQRLQAMVERLAPVRDQVLGRAAVNAGDTLLDVGCGDGLIGFAALDRVGPAGRVIFADISQDLLDLCRRLAVEMDLDGRCAFVRTSADRLDPVADASVDVVTTRSVLIYVSDKLACFRQFHRVLRAGGRLSVYEPINAFAAPNMLRERFCGYDITPVADLAARVSDLFMRLQPADTDPMLDFDERDLLRAAEQAGFAEIHLQLLADIEPRLPAMSWDAFLNTAGNPRIPTIAEGIARTLTAAESERFQSHLRPQVEAGHGLHRMAIAHLWATN